MPIDPIYLQEVAEELTVKLHRIALEDVDAQGFKRDVDAVPILLVTYTRLVGILMRASDDVYPGSAQMNLDMHVTELKRLLNLS